MPVDHDARTITLPCLATISMLRRDVRNCTYTPGTRSTIETSLKTTVVNPEITSTRCNPVHIVSNTDGFPFAPGTVNCQTFEPGIRNGATSIVTPRISATRSIQLSSYGSVTILELRGRSASEPSVMLKPEIRLRYTGPLAQVRHMSTLF